MANPQPLNPRVVLIEPGTGRVTREGFQFLQAIRQKVDFDGDLVSTDEAQTLTNKTMDGDLNTFIDIGTGSLKSRTGVDADVVTGTAGPASQLAMWNGDGDLVDTGILASFVVTLTAGQTLTNKTIDGDDNTLQDIGTASLKARTGADASVVTGTAGVNGNLAQWNADGDAVDSGVSSADVLQTSDIGSSVQAFDATLQSLSALGTASGRFAYTTAVDTWAEAAITAAGRALLDDADASAQRTTLGLGSLATANTINNSDWSGADLAVANGGTGASTASDARTNLEIVSGSWTPTLTTVANLDGATANTCHYVRIGAIVICFGSLAPDPTAAADTNTQLRATLPVASNFTATTDLSGSFGANGAQRAGRIYADGTNDEALFEWQSERTGAFTLNFMFGYQIL